MNNKGPLRIIIADDHSVVRSGVIRSLQSAFPEIETEEAANSSQIMSLLNSSDYDILILDINMPGRNGLEILSHVVSNFPATKVIIFSMYSEDQFAIRAIKAGASAYITKDSPLKELNDAVSKISRGERFFTPSIAELLVNEVAGHHSDKLPHNELSDREYQVFQMIASGKAVSDIAKELSLSVKTISVYRANILRKMALKNNAEITHYAFRNSLINV